MGDMWGATLGERLGGVFEEAYQVREARSGQWLVRRESRGESLRVEEREVRIVVAAVEIARQKVRREGMWLSTT